MLVDFMQKRLADANLFLPTLFIICTRYFGLFALYSLTR